jgi:hypothetical protein
MFYFELSQGIVRFTIALCCSHHIYSHQHNKSWAPKPISSQYGDYLG